MFYKQAVEQMCLVEIILGTDMVSKNAYYLLWRLIWDYKVNPNQGTKEWADRVKILQIYIPYVPSKVLNKIGADKQAFTEYQMWEILDSNLLQVFEPAFKQESQENNQIGRKSSWRRKCL